MNEMTALLGMGAAICVGAASPGPSFVMVARTAAAHGRGSGLGAALGMGLGAVLFAAAALLGLKAVFATVPVLYTALKLFGGLYLAYLGVRIWRGARQPLDTASDGEGVAVPRRSHFLLGLATQVSNPKAAIVYASVFAAFLPPAPGLAFDAAAIALVFCIETGWYAIVATVLSSPAPRATYLRCKKWVDRATGGILCVLGVKLVIAAVPR